MKGDKMNTKNYIFYPYSHKSYGFIRGLQSLNIKFDVISPNGFGLMGKDTSYAVNGKELGKKVKGYLDIEFSSYDSIIISDNLNDSMEDELIQIIERSKENNLEIINYCNKEKYIKLISNGLLVKSTKYQKEESIISYMDRLEELNLPFYSPEKLMIAVGGILQTIDNFYISLQIKIGLEKMGYSVEMITNESDGEFFNCLKYPEEFMQINIRPEEQIQKLNRYIQAVENEINPDIIIMDLPTGLITYDKYYNNSFGIYGFMIGQSVRPDYFILNTSYDSISQEYFGRLNNYFEIILGKKVDIFNITNSIFQDDNTVKTQLDSPMYLKHEDLQDLLMRGNKIDFKIDSLYETKKINNMIKELIDNFT